MTRKELDKYFSRPMYDDNARKYAKRVMDSHPEITDPVVIDFAVGKIEECLDDGVEISVDDALRLTKEHAPIPTAQDFLNTLSKGGITTQDDLISLLERGFEGITRNENISASLAERAAKMTKLGCELSDGNKDIVLMGIPADLSQGNPQVKVAFFTEDLSERELEIIGELRSMADRVKYKEEYGIGYGMFKLDI